MKKIVLSTALLFALASSAQVHAQKIIADWNFDSTADSTQITSVPTGSSSASISADIGTGTASSLHASSLAAYSSPAGNGQGGSFSSTNWSVGDSYKFTVSTLNYSNIQVSWDQTGSNTGPRDFTLEYSINGGAYVAAGNYSILANASPNTPWSGAGGASRNSAYTLNGNTLDLNLGSQVANATSVSFELVDADTISANGGSVATGGTDRVDNFVVSGTAVATPEPSAWALGALSIAAFAFLRRRWVGKQNS